MYVRRTTSVKPFCTPSAMLDGLSTVHTVYMAKKVRPRPKAATAYRKTFIREWRKSRGLTLERLADRVGASVGGFTHASLSRIENGKQPYSQPILEALAEALGTDPVSLLIRNPTDPEGMWSIWDQAQAGERKMIVDIAKTLVKRAG